MRPFSDRLSQPAISSRHPAQTTSKTSISNVGGRIKSVCGLRLHVRVCVSMIVVHTNTKGVFVCVCVTQSRLVDSLLR